MIPRLKRTRTIHSSFVIRHSPDMRTVHLLRKYDPSQWGGTETAIQRLFAGWRGHDVESVVYCPSLGRKTGPDPLAADGHRVKRFRAFLNGNVRLFPSAAT
jgi:hypothetical protein